MSKCPSCGNTIARFRMEQASAQAPGSVDVWKCTAYCCPHCGVAVSVQIDPTLIREEIIDRITRALRDR